MVSPSEKGNVVSALIDTISGVIQPILAVLCAAGMIKGVLSILVALGWITATDGLYQILYAAGDGFFYFPADYPWLYRGKEVWL